jgi:kynurenine 3-monooxygenase
MTGHVVIIGAGLAGSLAAGFLARRGHAVTVYERRADPRAAGAGEGRSINLGLSARGMRALDAAGLLDEVLARSVPMRGRVVHHPDGSTAFQPYGVAEHQILHSVLRRDLNALLVDAAESRHGVKFHFGHRLDRLDRDRPSVRVTDLASGAAAQVDADLVVGADGASSAVRDQLQQGRRADLHREFLDWGYKELTIPAGDDGRPRVRLDALHVWPGTAGMMVAHPNVDGSLTCTLFAPFTGEPSLASLDTPAAVLAYVRRYFPDAEALMPRLVEEFFDHPVGQLTTVRTAPWRHDGRVVLLGDACHAVYPFYGQGMNSAFEDCLVLDACLAEFPADRSRALAEYERRRRPHTDVLAQLSARNFVELRDRVHRPAYAARAAADRILARLAPRAWTPLYTMVAHTTVPYADALARARRQDMILRCAAAAVAAGAAIGGHTALRHLRRR